MASKQEIKWLLRDKHRGQKTKEFYADLKRLEKGEPLDYVIGWKPFLSCHIDLAKKPLIPRPETEYWTQKAIEDIKQNPKKQIKCLDIFSGSGCIGVAILKNTQKTKVSLAEKYQKFIRQIKINLDLNEANFQRYQILKSDIFNLIKDRYDYILANPPYISKTNQAEIQKSVILHEPQKALFADMEGLAYIDRFLRQAKKYLKPNGKIYLEFGFKQKDRIEELIKKYEYKNYAFFKDQFKRWRYVVIE